MNPFEWWANLPFDLEKGRWGEKRERPLTWKELFFRDKLAVVTFVSSCILLLMIIIQFLKTFEVLR